MKIVYFIPHLRGMGGMSRVLSIKANYLTEFLNYEVTIITYRHKSSDKSFYEFNKKIVFHHLELDDPTFKLKEYSFFEKRRRIKNFMTSYRSKVENYLINNKTDVAISMFLGAEYKFLNEIKDDSKKIIEFHFNFDTLPLKWLNSPINIKDLRIHFNIKKLQSRLRKYDRLIVLSEEDAKTWKEHFNNVSSISNPITIKSETLIASLQGKKALAIGRLAEQKGFDYLIKAWSIVTKKNSDWTLHIYGEGNLQEKLAQMIIENKLEKSVFIHPPVANVERVYIESDLFILSSRFEGFVLSLLEAMSCGLPCVSFDCKYGPTQLIENRENGYLVPLGDVEGLAEKIQILINDESLRIEFGKRAKETSENYSVPIIMSHWEELFQQL